MGINNSVPIKTIIANRLRTAREARKYSRAKFCEEINRLHQGESYKELQPETLKQWELGKNAISVDRIPDICQILGCDAGYLFGVYEEATYSVAKECERTGLSEDTVLNLREIATQHDVITAAVYSFLEDLTDDLLNFPLMALRYKDYRDRKPQSGSYIIIDEDSGKHIDSVYGDIAKIILQNSFNKFLDAPKEISRREMRRIRSSYTEEELIDLAIAHEEDRLRGK